MQMTDIGAGFARGGLAAMPALEDAPELYHPAARPDDPLTRSGARLDEDFALAAARNATALVTGLMDQPPESPSDGFAAVLLTRFDDDSAALLENAPSPAAQDAARAAIGRARGRLADWALPQEAAARTVARRQGLIDGLAQFRAAAERQPDDVEALQAEGDAAIAGAADWLGADAAEQLGAQWQREIYQSSLQSLIRSDPDDAIRRLADARYAPPLAGVQRASLVREAEARAAVLARDRSQARDTALQDADVRRETERWQFRAAFLKGLRDGSASHRALDDAERDGTITPVDRAQLEPRLIERQAAARTRADRAAHVSDYLDGRGGARPTAEDIGAHYQTVMGPVIEATPSEDRGRLYLDYLRGLGHHDVAYQPGNVETGLPPPTDAPVDPQAIYRMLGYPQDPDTAKGEVALALDDAEGGALAAAAAAEAVMVTNGIFAGLPTHNSPADAFRHAYWNFVMTRQTIGQTGVFGHENAKKFADGHEVEHWRRTLFGWLPENLTGPREWPEDERLMDLYNNAAGRALALLPENADRPARDVILQALEENKLQTIPMSIASPSDPN